MSTEERTEPGIEIARVDDRAEHDDHEHHDEQATERRGRHAAMDVPGLLGFECVLELHACHAGAGPFRAQPYFRTGVGRPREAAHTNSPLVRTAPPLAIWSICRSPLWGIVRAMTSPIVSPSREALLGALYEAAELEHNLMCTYLYAAFSLRSGEAEGLSKDEAAAVARWRQTIIDVAIDEMGHLAAVWNITAALGGSPRFGRGNFPLDPGMLPAGIVVKLAPFNEAVLQHFIFLERPHGSTEQDGRGLHARAAIQAWDEPRAAHADGDGLRHGRHVLRGAGGEPAQVRRAARRVERVLRRPDPAAFGCGSDSCRARSRSSASRRRWRRSMRSCGRGKGRPRSRRTLHYQRFLSIREELARAEGGESGVLARVSGGGESGAPAAAPAAGAGVDRE